ncbi:conserved hypothetical protein [Coccidioides posadasii str. Silveira]|uniref:Uncharacterized protein n=1 Tax=Coccidioides posadasii (strain RMSCC 757 / Silveira) TaxID=443226 RepID=E9DIM4_COCPS|nr:conserved hypothetical protein [Coccidioides posadasii str. Silveira]
MKCCMESVNAKKVKQRSTKIVSNTMTHFFIPAVPGHTTQQILWLLHAHGIAVDSSGEDEFNVDALPTTVVHDSWHLQLTVILQAAIISAGSHDQIVPRT